MFGWTVLAILIGIITFVVVSAHKTEKRGQEFGWDFLTNLIISLVILWGCVRLFETMSKQSPSESGFWIALILGVLTALLFFNFVRTWDAASDKERRLKELDSLLRDTGCWNTYDLQRKIEKLEHPE
jgi:CDP-diglyceride synthetase